MVIKQKTALLIIALWALLNLQFSCDKGFSCAENVYNFELLAKAYPDKDSINVGDTIWLEINQSTVLKDGQSGADVNYKNVENLGSFISFQKLGMDNFTINAANSFNYKLIEGTDITNANRELGREYKFLEKNDRFLFLIGIVPKQKGIFRLFFSNAANVFRKSDRCTKATFTINFQSTNQHIYFFPGNSGPTFGGGVYYFKVI